MALPPIKYLWTLKGDILTQILVWGAGGLGDILEFAANGSYEEYSNEEVKQAFHELVQDGELFLNSQGYYDGGPELVQQYQYYEEHMGEYMGEFLNNLSYDEDIEEPEIRRTQNIVDSAESWVKLQAPNITYNNDHCFLEGHYLDGFIRFIFTRAEKTIIAVTPFFDLSIPMKLLIKAKQNGLTAVLLTRPPSTPYSKNVHKSLSEKGLKLLYHKGIHAKIIVVDDMLAVVSSMNFQKNATAGITWEAGLMTVNKSIVNSIKSSLADLNPQSSNL